MDDVVTEQYNSYTADKRKQQAQSLTYFPGDSKCTETGRLDDSEKNSTA
jgi:hypothetical protein